MSAATLIEQAKGAGVELRLVDGKVRVRGATDAVERLLPLLRQHKKDLICWLSAKRLFRQRGPWLTDLQQTAAQAYHRHHFACPQCKAAGRGDQYCTRCAVGLALWSDYSGLITASDSQTEGA